MKGIRNWGPALLLISPTIVLIGIFVYGLIGKTLQISVSNRYSIGPATEYVGLENFTNLFKEARFQHAMITLGTFTVVFMGGTLFFGLLWALLLERGVRGEGVFRSFYLFPMAISFVASGVVWRWLLNSSQGEGASGLNRLFQVVGLDAFENAWWSSP